MLKMIGIDNFIVKVKNMPDFQLVAWARNLEILTESYDTAFYSDFYKMLKILYREIVNRLENRLEENE